VVIQPDAKLHAAQPALRRPSTGAKTAKNRSSFSCSVMTRKTGSIEKISCACGLKRNENEVSSMHFHFRVLTLLNLVDLA
jgi:hypothetical protein